jgi:hypothetical protein
VICPGFSRSLKIKAGAMLSMVSLSIEPFAKQGQIAARACAEVPPARCHEADAEPSRQVEVAVRQEREPSLRIDPVRPSLDYPRVVWGGADQPNEAAAFEVHGAREDLVEMDLITLRSESADDPDQNGPSLAHQARKLTDLPWVFAR